MIPRRLQYEVAGRITGPILMTLEKYRQQRSRRKRMPEDNLFGPPFECARKMKDLMSIYYYQGRWADGAVPVAW